MDSTKPLLRVSEVAEALNIGRSKAYELVATGQLPALRVGRAVRVRPEAVVDWIARSEAMAR